MEVFIGVDIGTTGIRAVVYDEDFMLLGSGSGQSFIAASVAGHIDNVRDAVNKIISIKKEYTPGPERHKRYEAAVGRYKKILETAPNEVLIVKFNDKTAGDSYNDVQFNCHKKRCVKRGALFKN